VNGVGLVFKGLMMTALLVSAAACGTGGGASQEKGQSVEGDSSKVEPAKAKEPIELVFYHTGSNWNSEGFFEKEIAEPIRAKYPYITPKFIPTTAAKLDQLVASKQTLDIVISSIGAIYSTVIQYELAGDMAPLVQTNRVDSNRFEPSSLKMIQQISGGNRLIGFPFDELAAVMYYNKDLFNKFGVAYPKDGLTWDDYYEIAKKMTRNEGGQQYYGFAMAPNHYFLRNQLSLNLVDPATYQAMLNTDGAKSLVLSAARFYQLPGYNPTKSNLSTSGQKALFLNQTAAMYTPISGLFTEKDLGSLNWDLSTYPVLKESPGVGAQPYPTFMMLGSGSKHKEDAFQVINYLASEEFMLNKAKTTVFLPLLSSQTVKAAFGQDAPMYKGKNLGAIITPQKAAPSPQSPYFTAAGTQLGTNVLQAVAIEGKDVNSALREAEEAVLKQVAADKMK
jgi:multiple sugar transport system substrate-binding protein